MTRFKTILVTGGAGYIGSHCIVDLIGAGHEVIAIDNFANAVEDEDGSPALQRAERITGKKITFYKADLLDKTEINDIFDKVSFCLKIVLITVCNSTLIAFVAHVINGFSRCDQKHKIFDFSQL